MSLNKTDHQPYQSAGLVVVVCLVFCFFVLIWYGDQGCKMKITVSTIGASIKTTAISVFSSIRRTENNANYPENRLLRFSNQHIDSKISHEGIKMKLYH